MNTKNPEKNKITTKKKDEIIDVTPQDKNKRYVRPFDEDEEWLKHFTFFLK